MVPGGVAKSKAKPPPVKICVECKGELAPGVSHICTRGERNQNIVELFKSVSERSRGQILSQSLKGKIIFTKKGYIIFKNEDIRGQGACI